MTEKCPLEGTKHFDACGISSNKDACPFKSECGQMLQDEARQVMSGVNAPDTDSECGAVR